MLELVSADSRLRVCFDVNHLCQAYGSTHAEFVEKLGHLIVTTHMSDYDFIDEKHFFPGYGMIDWCSLVEHLENADYSGPFLYEGGFSPSARAPEVPHGTFEMARERHMTIKELHGQKA
jgi:sugar phosphate isomerase/epimerase